MQHVSDAVLSLLTYVLQLHERLSGAYPVILPTMERIQGCLDSHVNNGIMMHTIWVDKHHSHKPYVQLATNRLHDKCYVTKRYVRACELGGHLQEVVNNV